jgi:hypothetical protein
MHPANLACKSFGLPLQAAWLMSLRICENNRLELEFDHALTHETRFISSSR